jgi:hypothetical protein
MRLIAVGRVRTRVRCSTSSRRKTGENQQQKQQLQQNQNSKKQEVRDSVRVRTARRRRPERPGRSCPRSAGRAGSPGSSWPPCRRRRSPAKESPGPNVVSSINKQQATSNKQHLLMENTMLKQKSEENIKWLGEKRIGE